MMRQMEQDGDDDCPSLCAFLWKLGGKVKSWRRRWFVLANCRLDYWKDEKLMNECLGSVNVERSTVFAFDEGAFGRKGYLFGIEPVNMRRTYILEAATTEERDKWILTLKLHGGVDKGETGNTNDYEPISESTTYRHSTPIESTTRNEPSRVRMGNNILNASQRDLALGGVVAWVPDEW